MVIVLLEILLVLGLCIQQGISIYDAWSLTQAPLPSTWRSISSDSAGQYLAAVTYTGSFSAGTIYTSSSSGGTWSRTSVPLGNWYDITSDSTGMNLAACQYDVSGSGGGSIYTSTSGGLSWSLTSSPKAYWSSITSNSTGQFIAAVVNNGNGGIYISSSGGSYWTLASSVLGHWSSITSDKKGQFIAATQQSTSSFTKGSIYVSSSGGKTWSMCVSTTGYWASITSNSAGSLLAAVQTNSSYIYISSSSPYGSSWTSVLALSFKGNWVSIVSDSIGQYLVAALEAGGIYISSTGGTSWSQTQAPSTTWYGVALSSNGGLLAAVVNNGGIYTSTMSGPTSQPTGQPTEQPSSQPSSQPSLQPSRQPSLQPSSQPSSQPSCHPSCQPSCQPTVKPSSQPSSQPSIQPTSQPSVEPSSQPSRQPSLKPSSQPSCQPSSRPSIPTTQPTSQPTNPTGQPTSQPSSPTSQPTSQPTNPTGQPSSQPTSPTSHPSSKPSLQPSSNPTIHIPTNANGITLTIPVLKSTTSKTTTTFTNMGTFKSGYPVYISLSISNFALTGSQSIKVFVGPDAAPCVTRSCSIDNYCSSKNYTCFFNVPLSSKCYSSAVGGSILVQVLPSYSLPDFKQCSANPNVLFYTNIELGSVPIPTDSPTFAPLKLEDYILALYSLYAISFAFVGFVVYGVVLVRLRITTDKLHQLKVYTVYGTLGLFGCCILTEISYISAIFAYNMPKFTACAVLIILARLLHIPCGYIILKDIWQLDKQPSQYLSLLDEENLMINRSMYLPLFGCIFFDNTNAMYLPWLSTKFSNLTGGYPDILMYRACTSVKLTQSFVSAVLQTAILAMVERTGYGFLELDVQIQAIICLSYILAMFTFLITLISVLLYSIKLRELSDNDSRATESSNSIFRLTHMVSRTSSIARDNVATLGEYIRYLNNNYNKTTTDNNTIMIRVLNEENNDMAIENNILKSTIATLSERVLILKHSMVSEIDDLKSHIQLLDHSKDNI